MSKIRSESGGNSVRRSGLVELLQSCSFIPLNALSRPDSVLFITVSSPLSHCAYNPLSPIYDFIDKIKIIRPDLLQRAHLDRVNFTVYKYNLDYLLCNRGYNNLEKCRFWLQHCFKQVTFVPNLFYIISRWFTFLGTRQIENIGFIRWRILSLCTESISFRYH